MGPFLLSIFEKYWKCFKLLCVKLAKLLRANLAETKYPTGRQ